MAERQVRFGAVALILIGMALLAGVGIGLWLGRGSGSGSPPPLPEGGPTAAIPSADRVFYPERKVRLNEPAPDFALPTGEGTRIQLASLRGKVVLLNFWATWCPPCRAEMPVLESAYRRYGDDGFVVLAVDVGETAEQVRAFREEFGITFPTVLDPGPVADAYGVLGIPTSFFLDREGVVRLRWSGPVDEGLVRQKVEELLNR